MKGTFAILGILFAAYAAPLCFAEQIVMSEFGSQDIVHASSIWDVAMSPWGELKWVMVQPLDSENSSVVWGTLGEEDSTSFIVPFADPRICALTFPDSTTTFAWTAFRTLASWELDTLFLIGMTLGTTGSIDYVHQWPDSGFGELEEWEGDDQIFPKLLFAFPPPPYVTRRLGFVLSSRHLAYIDWPVNVTWQRSTFVSIDVHTDTYESEILDSLAHWHVDVDSVSAALVGEGGHIWGRPELDVRRTFSWNDDNNALPTEITRLPGDYYQECLLLNCCSIRPRRADPMVMGWLYNQPGPYLVFGLSDACSCIVWQRQIDIFNVCLEGNVVPDSASPGDELVTYRTDVGFQHILSPESGSVWGTINCQGLSVCNEPRTVRRFPGETDDIALRRINSLSVFRIDTVISDADDARTELPEELTLAAYPNPFNPTTMIAFDLPKAGNATLAVYDLNGRLVQTLVDEKMNAGHHELGFDGASLPSGIYFARLVAASQAQTHKLVLLK